MRLGIEGAAIATIISQTLSAAYVFYFLRKKSELKVRMLSKAEWKVCGADAKNIVSLGSAGFIMQLTNSLVTICCNSVLSGIGGDVYISVMTIVSSIRQMVETPIYAMNEGTSPILSYNYGAQRPKRVRKAIRVMTCMILIYTAIMWSVIIFAPEFLIGIFSSDKELLVDAVEALKLYFAAFIFMDLQYIGQTVFKSLNKKKQAIFFSLLRKVFIVVPLTYLFPYIFHMGTRGVFLAEPISNVIGGSLCFITMLAIVMPELKRMKEANYEKILVQIKEKLPETQVYMMAYYPVKEDAPLPKWEWGRTMFKNRNNTNIPIANEEVKKLADKFGYTYIDVNNGLTDVNGNLKEEYTIEGVHMYANAYRCVLENLKQYL